MRVETLEEFGAQVFLAQIACGGVVYLGTPLGDNISVLAVAAVVALIFAVLGLWRLDDIEAAEGVSSMSAALAILYYIHPEAKLSGIFLVVYSAISIGAAALAAMLVEGDKPFVQRLMSALPVIGGLKSLNARFWGFWLRRGSAG